jgi:hypothetical protein
MEASKRVGEAPRGRHVGRTLDGRGLLMEGDITRFLEPEREWVPCGLFEPGWDGTGLRRLLGSSSARL